MKSLRSILALGAFFVVMVAVAGCGSSSSGSSVPGDSVAVVAGNPITTKAFKHWMFVAAQGQAAQSPGSPVIVPDPPNYTQCMAEARKDIPSLAKTPAKTLKTDCSQLFTTLSGQVMDFLIKAYWYQADAHKIGINITNAQVQKALTTAKKSQFSTDAQFQSFLKTSGQTVQDIVFRVRVNQIFQKLSAKHPTTVTQTAITNYYNSHKSQFGTPETRNMDIVLTKTQAEANTAKAAIQGGQSWAAVAKKYSIDPSKSKGGALNGVTAGQQDSSLSKAAFAAPANKLIGPVKSQFGYYLIRVTKIKAATQRSLAQSSALIKQTLTSQLQTAAQTAVDNHAKQDWLKKTSCRKIYAMADCNGYKAPKTSSTAGAAGATAPAGAATAPAGAATAPAGATGTAAAPAGTGTAAP
ncbi:MAG TPA: peptidyl-prolyl cis-trans isomerase [Solirubrobacteraceae bacterium]|nr:peptidyl-prolyl cis-trans isomerase [Solirubrobacteraceae bacterium]